jgi:hypothetical protein
MIRKNSSHTWFNQDRRAALAGVAERLEAVTAAQSDEQPRRPLIER